MTLGQNIQAARKAQGLSQEALAARVGVSRQALGKWEKDTALPGLDNLQALAEVLGQPVDALLGRTGENPAAGPVMTLDAMRTLLEARDAEQARARHRTAVLALAVLAVLLALAGSVLGGYRAQLDAANARLDALSSAAGQTNANIAGLAGQMEELQQAVRQGKSTVLTWDYTLEGTPGQLQAVRNLPLVIRVMPRTGQPGLQAELLADRQGAPDGGAQDVLALEELPSGYFSAQGSFHKGDCLSLTVRWLYPDGSTVMEELGQISLDESGLYPVFSWPYTEDKLSYRYYEHPERGTLSLACLPVEVEVFVPEWMTPQSGEISLLVDGEERAAVPLKVYPDDRGATFGYTATFREEDAEQPYAGGDVALLACLVDSAGNVWESGLRPLEPMP